MNSLRKLLAITLLALLGLPFASSLFALAPKDDGSLPVCCRRNGKHHCMMSTADRAKLLGNGPAFSAPLEKCPFTPAALLGAPHPPTADVPPGQIFFAGLISHPVVSAQMESKWRISRDRSRQKRGPPSFNP